MQSKYEDYIISKILKNIAFRFSYYFSCCFLLQSFGFRSIVHYVASCTPYTISARTRSEKNFQKLFFNISVKMHRRKVQEEAEHCETFILEVCPQLYLEAWNKRLFLNVIGAFPFSFNSSGHLYFLIFLTSIISSQSTPICHLLKLDQKPQVTKAAFATCPIT